MSARMSADDTKAAMQTVVSEMYDKIVKGEAPTMTLPVRTKNNIGFDRKLGVYKYGKKAEKSTHFSIILLPFLGEQVKS